MARGKQVIVKGFGMIELKGCVSHIWFFALNNLIDFGRNSKYRIYSKTIRGFLFFFSQKLRITFECGLHSSADFIFFFFKRFPIRPK